MLQNIHLSILLTQISNSSQQCVQKNNQKENWNIAPEKSP
jgi:hypothetical protein